MSISILFIKCSANTSMDDESRPKNMKKYTGMNGERLDALSDATRHVVVESFALDIKRSCEEGVAIINFLHFMPGNPILLNPQVRSNGLCFGGPAAYNAQWSVPKPLELFRWCVWHV
jgi:hypothetical protein